MFINTYFIILQKVQLRFVFKEKWFLTFLTRFLHSAVTGANSYHINGHFCKEGELMLR